MNRSLVLCWALFSAACDRAPPPAARDATPETQLEVPTQAPTSSAAAVGPKPGAAPAPQATDKTSGSPASRRRYVVAALGDSITDSRNGGGGYLATAQKACPESTFLNFGKGGDMVNQMLRRFKTDVLPVVAEKHIDTLVVYGGVNDLYSDLTAGRKNEVIERDLTTIYRLAKSAGLRVVAITVSPWGGFTQYWNERRGENTRLLNSWILGAVARGEAALAVDSFPLLSCGQPDQLCEAFERRVADGLHPGPGGHELLGQKLVEVALADCR